MKIPRLVIAGTHSGVGKTTVMLGLARALRSQGLEIATFKCGPDYLDPTYHQLCSDKPCHNLDGWMMGRQAVIDTFINASQGCDLALIEGVMGLFDGASPNDESGSTAQIAKWLSAPVLLTIDASGMARTIGAFALGFKAFDPDLDLVGICANRLGSVRHLELLRRSGPCLSIIGGLTKQPELSFPERHLGLWTADSKNVPEKLLKSWEENTSRGFKLEKVSELARSAPPLLEGSPNEDFSKPACRIGIAHDDAFYFYYEDNLRRLCQLGAKLVYFSPIKDHSLPDVDGLYLGGGYPEARAFELSSNLEMHHAIEKFAMSGRPIYAECGGFMYLCNTLHTLDGQTHKMVGIFPAKVVMSDKLKALGYVEVETQADSIFGEQGMRFRGHQFRYSTVESIDDSVNTLFKLRKRRGGEVSMEGYCTKNVLGSYVHAHWASNPSVAKEFVNACKRTVERNLC